MKDKEAIRGIMYATIITAPVLFVMMLLQGCSSQSFLFDSQNTRGGFVVTKPPIQVTYRGGISEEQHEHMMDVLRKVKTIPFVDYKFNTDHNVRLNSIDGKSDKIDIKLVESTSTPSEAKAEKDEME